MTRKALNLELMTPKESYTISKDVPEKALSFIRCLRSIKIDLLDYFFLSSEIHNESCLAHTIYAYSVSPLWDYAKIDREIISNIALSISTGHVDKNSILLPALKFIEFDNGIFLKIEDFCCRIPDEVKVKPLRTSLLMCVPEQGNRIKFIFQY